MLYSRAPNSAKNSAILLEFKKGKLGHLGEVFCFGVASYKKELLIKKEVL